MADSSNPPVSLTGQRILVVEDEFFLADDVETALRDIGATIVGPINNVAEASRAASADALDGAALDVNVRGQAIYAVARELQARGLPFIFMTGYGRDAILPEYRHVPRFEKPFDPAALAAELATLLRARR